MAPPTHRSHLPLALSRTTSTLDTDAQRPLRQYIDLWLTCKNEHDFSGYDLYQHVYIPFSKTLSENDRRLAAKFRDWVYYRVQERRDEVVLEKVQHQVTLLVIARKRRLQLLEEAREVLEDRSRNQELEGQEVDSK